MNKAKPQPPRQDAARKGALRLIAGVRDGVALTEQSGALARLAPHERARAQRLALGVLRNIDRADTLLAQHLSKKPRPEVLDVLRLGTVELLEMGEAPHGVVNAAVGLMRSKGPKGRAAAAMVNAVLRKISAQGAEWATLPPEEMPDWLRGPVIAAWGEDVALSIETAHQNGAPVDLTSKPRAEAPGEALPTGSFRLRDAGQISALPGYVDGTWWVQDAAAALAVRWLEPKQGERIVDLRGAGRQDIADRRGRGRGHGGRYSEARLVRLRKISTAADCAPRWSRRTRSTGPRALRPTRSFWTRRALPPGRSGGIPTCR